MGGGKIVVRGAHASPGSRSGRLNEGKILGGAGNRGLRGVTVKKRVMVTKRGSPPKTAKISWDRGGGLMRKVHPNLAIKNHLNGGGTGLKRKRGILTAGWKSHLIKNTWKREGNSRRFI